MVWTCFTSKGVGRRHLCRCGRAAGEQSPALERKDVLARFYLSRLPIETARHLDLMRSESESVLSLPAAAF